MSSGLGPCDGSSSNYRTGAMFFFFHADQFQALKMVAEREAKAIASGDADDASYSSADIQDLPKPPYYFKVSLWNGSGSRV